MPFDAIKVFFDPSVPYGLQFEDFDIAGAAAQELAGSQRESGSLERGTRERTKRTRVPDAPAAPRRRRSRAQRAGLQSEKAADRAPQRAPTRRPAKSLPTVVKPAEPTPAKGPKVVSIDAFRKK